MISIHALREEGDGKTAGFDKPKNDFNPRPPRGGRHYYFFCPDRILWISIHALREESDRTTGSWHIDQHHFNPRPPRGGRHDDSHVENLLREFQSTPSARRATLNNGRFHSLAFAFQSTPSARRATRRSLSTACSRPYFNPRPPRGGRPVKTGRSKGQRLEFQSTPSARRATNAELCQAGFFGISIHALREEGDLGVVLLSLKHKNFNPRPPRGGRLHCIAPLIHIQTISIHALREEGDTDRENEIETGYKFQSTPSARRATGPRGVGQRAGVISIHALREEGDGQTISQCATSIISIHALREEGDCSGTGKTTVTYTFQSTPSSRRATGKKRAELALTGISIHALREEGDLPPSQP